MSKPKMIVGLLGTFLVGSVASQMTAFVVPPARAGTLRQKWEYICNDEYNAKDVTAMANSLGTQGWEMAAAAGAPRMTWCFKRALP